MTLAEFKAWFEGFTEEMDDAPTKKQWERIRKRVKEIDGSPVTEQVFIDHPWHPQRLRGYWELMNQYKSAAQNQPKAEFGPSQAMYALGRTECKSEAA